MKSTSSTTLGCSCSTSSSSLLSLSERENWIRIQFKSNDIAVDIITPIVTIWWRCLHYCCAFCCIVATESEIFQAKAAEACNKTFLSFWVHDRVNIRRLSLGRVVIESSIFLSSSFEFSSTSGDDIRRHWSYEREVDLLNWFFFIHRLFSISFETHNCMTDIVAAWWAQLFGMDKKNSTYTVVFPKMIFKFNVKCN